MKKITVFAFLAIFAGMFASTPTLDIVSDAAKDVTVDGKTVKFDGEIKEIDGAKVMAFGEKPFALPAKNLVGEKGSIVMEYAINTKNSKNGARPLVCLRLESTKQIAFFTFHGNPVIQLRFGNPVFADKKVRLTPDKIHQSAVTWNGEKICFYLDGQLVKEMPQPLPVLTKNIGYITVGPFKDQYFVTPPWDNDCYMKRLTVYNEAITASDIAALRK